MDTLRGHFGSGDYSDDHRDYDPAEDEIGNEAPPSPIGQDERRMQVRAYNHWAGLLHDRNFPSIEDLEPDNLPDFGPYSVLLDFTSGIENPAVPYIGDKLAGECDATSDIETLADVPSRSLLSRITDHYMQILANQAPIGFEAEFVNQRGSTILYRGILLPFSSDDDTIDFIYGVINWKEMADQLTADELLLEIDQALDQDSDGDFDGGDEDEDVAPREADPISDWADGPADTSALDLAATIDLDSAADDEAELHDDFDNPAYAVGACEDDADDDADHDGDDFEAGDFYSPANDRDFDSSEASTGSLLSMPMPFADDGDEDGDDAWDEYGEDGSMPQPMFGLIGRKPARDADSEPPSIAEQLARKKQALDRSPLADIASYDDDFAPMAEPLEHDMQAEDGGELDLYNALAAAREMAVAARSSEDRTRNALYQAVGRAYDFSISAQENPEEFEELVSENGLTTQDRAPMTPVVKLVFGADYDKTRLTEYAAVLSHGHRLGVERGKLADFLTQAEGGLKGVVTAERRLRREEAGKPVEDAEGPRAALARKLRAIAPLGFEDIAEDGPEFALVMVRRTETGEIVVLGEVPEDIPLIERAARKLVA